MRRRHDVSRSGERFVAPAAWPVSVGPVTTTGHPFLERDNEARERLHHCGEYGTGGTAGWIVVERRAHVRKGERCDWHRGRSERKGSEEGVGEGRTGPQALSGVLSEFRTTGHIVPRRRCDVGRCLLWGSPGEEPESLRLLRYTRRLDGGRTDTLVSVEVWARIGVAVVRATAARRSSCAHCLQYDN